ncbi:type II CRISPR RNA-guided endonuclease Cas9 [Reichenbachiella sp. MALMAid0571]|uniref:type II CRISPR RNA-guided endonuclease Cas9 n=1 Tax=Reichenbachiella sp. MALMAid0571 TaxID=3143939 RepID=UPI0032DF0AAD
MKKILGLDLGTNSIGWALVEIDHENGTVKIIALGSRILPMDAGEIGDFEASGKIKSAAAARTEKRGPRRLNERYLLRRDRLHLVLNLLDALPQHYKLEIDFTNEKGEKCGQFKENKEPKFAYLPKKHGQKSEFLFMDSYEEMLKDIGHESVKNEKGKRIPYDWTLYYLRDKALKEKETLEKENKKPLTLEELAWVLLSYNQKRGYEKIEALDEFDDLSEKLNEFGITKIIQEAVDTSKIEIESLVLKVVQVFKAKDEFGTYFNIRLENGYSYKEYSTEQITELKDNIDEVKIVERFTILNDEGTDNDETKTIYKVEDIFELKVSDISPKDTKGKYLKKYGNGWQVDTNYSDFNKFKKTDREIKEEVFLTRLYNRKGELIKPSKKGDSLNLSISKDPFSEFKLLDPNKASNWRLLKKKTEKEALQFNSLNGYVDEKGNVENYISPKIYSILKDDAKTEKRTKIIGGMFQVVERDFYREELKQIIATQRKFHNSLKDAALFERCVKTLYPKNESHAKNLLSNKDTIEHLLVEDILLYQRPLKTKKSEIADCKYEIRHCQELRDKKTGKPIEIVDKETGEITISKEAIYHKAVSASHPFFQEFRIWDKLHNLRLTQLERKTDGKPSTNVDVTSDYFDKEAYQALYDLMNNRQSLNQKQFLSFCKSRFEIKDIENYVWNFPEDEELKGNETRVSFATRFNRCGFTEYADFLTQEKEIELWHYLYSVNYKERKENDSKSIKTFFNRFLNESVVSDEIKGKVIEGFTNYPKFASRYCAYSEKALKRLLPFLRMGENRFTGKFDLSAYKADLEIISHDKSRISSFIANSNKTGKEAEETRQSLYEALWKHSINERIDEILNRLSKIDFEAEEIEWKKFTDNDAKVPFPKGLFKAFREFKEATDFTSLDLTKTSYLVYGRHSELAQAIQWKSPDDIRKQLHQELKQHSLNNPVAEKVILEMMQVVADIWEHKELGNSQPNYFNEIHVEVGRELKKSVKEKEAETNRQKGNRAQNKRIRQVLEEFLASSPYNANPKNSDHFERLKIVEDAVLNQHQYKKKAERDDIDSLLKSPITKETFEKYKLWIEQGYRSPYTNLPIKLTDLFDGDKYNIDHVFPQASITNDSLSNKVVCEREVNKLKSDQTGREFVNQPKEREQYCVAHGKMVKIVDDDTYVSIVTSRFSGSKRYILLSKEIPKGFTNSQLNNARHIARKAMELLSHVVREEGEVEFLSKNVLPVTGAVTGKLKEEWRLDQVWKELVAPRFIRMNELTKSSLFGQERLSKSGHKYFDCNLDDSIRKKDESYNIKRIDHRHHALDALIVALCTRDHVNYINNINAGAKSPDFDKQRQIKKYRETLKRKLMFSKPKKDNPNEKDWYFMFPGEVRQPDAEESTRDTIKTMSYFYKDSDSKGDYKAMVLNALQHIVATFKQNLRVINKTVNRHESYKDENGNLRIGKNGKPEKGLISQKKIKNWAIRRSLGKGTFYGRVDIGERENKQLLKNIDFFFKYPDAIVDNELRGKIESIINETKSTERFEQRLKAQFKNEKVTCIAYQAVSRFNSELNTSFNRDKIKNQVADKGIQRILNRQLDEFDTVELPFEEALDYYEAVLEKHELGAIVSDNETDFDTFDDFTSYLRANHYRYQKVDYTKLNVFIDQVSDRKFRNEEQFKDKIVEHPEIAFTPEEIVKMNTPENLRKLNMNKKGEEKNHAPIRKVRTYTGFGNEKRVGNSENTNKYRQFVKVDKGTNFYIAIYEIDDKSKISRKNPLRLFKEISLFDLIDYQKSTSTNDLPIEKQIYSEDGESYRFLFTLTQNDSVKVDDQGHELIYAFNRFTGSNKSYDIYFRPINHASEIDEYEVDLKPINPKTGKNPGSQTNETTSLNGEQIKNICIKLNVDRLGNIKAAT